MLKRFATFMLLGPLLAWLSTAILLLPGPIHPDGAELAFYVVVLMFIVAFGLIPGAVLAGVDQVMVKLGWPRVLRAGLAPCWPIRWRRWRSGPRSISSACRAPPTRCPSTRCSA
jgi:hypothetical protein